MPTRGRSRRRSYTTNRRTQHGKNLRLKSSRLSSWKCPLSASSARRCTSCSADSSASGASSAANGAKFSDTRAKPRSRAHPIATVISHSLKPFGVERRRGIDDRLVAVVERVQTVRAVELELSLRGAEDRDPPVALVRELDEAPQER